jgi:tetratricopeptide (TPR) repeat protein
MSDEEKVNLEQIEKELWQEVSQTQGVQRARALAALGRVAWDRDKFNDSLAFCESARDLYLEAGRDDYFEEILDVSFGIMTSFDMLNEPEGAANAAGFIIELYREVDHPRLGELLRDEGRYWFALGEYEKSLAAHTEAISLINPDLSEISRGIDLLNIAMTKNRLERYDDSITDLKEALAIFKKEKNPKWVSKCHGELAEIYFNLEMPDETEEWGRKALDYAELTADARSGYWLNYYIGVSRRLKGEIDSAADFLAKAKYQVVHFGEQDWKALVKIEKEIAGIDFIKGNATQAEESLRRIATIEETLIAS